MADLDQERLTPKEFWKRYAPGAALLLDDDELTWDGVVSGLQRKAQMDKKTVRYLEQRLNSLEQIATEGKYDPKVGPLVFMCPDCGDTFMHIQEVFTVLSGDESGEDPIPGTVEAVWETGWRRPAVVIEIKGESCGHRFRLRLQQHKGEVFIFTESSYWKTVDRLPGDVEITPEARAILEGAALPQTGGGE